MADFSQAALGWLAHTAAAGAAVLLVGWLAVRATRGAAGRHRLAAGAFRAAVLVPVLCLFPAWLTVRLPAGWAGTAAHRAADPTPVAPAVGPFDDLRDAEPADLPTAGEFPLAYDPADRPAEFAPLSAVPAPAAPEPAPAVAPAPPADPLAGVGPLVLAGYAAAVGLLAGWLAVGQVGLARLVRGASPAPARVRAAFDRLATGLSPRPRVLVSDRVDTPVCFGVFRPTVLLPRAVAAGPAAELVWVFAHELDHVRRGDPATGWWAGAARALYFFVPWLWPLRRDLVLAQEYLADAAAAAAGGAPADYAAFLVTLSGGPARVPAGAFPVRAGRSDLFRRVNMLLESDAGATRRGSRWAVAAALGVLSTAVLLSGISFAAAGDEDDAPKPKKVEKKAKKAEPADPIEVEGVIEVVIDGDDLPPRPKVTATARKSEVAALKKKIAAAAKAGDADAVAELVEKLEKALAAQAPRAVPPPPPGVRVVPGLPAPPAPPAPGVRVVPGVPAVPGAPPAVRVRPAPAPEREKMAAEIEAALKKALEGVKDNPEAREQIEKAMKEARKALEQLKGELPKVEDARRMAEDARRAAEAELRTQREALRGRLDEQRDRLEAERAELRGRLEEQRARLDEQRGRLEERRAEAEKQAAEGDKAAKRAAEAEKQAVERAARDADRAAEAAARADAERAARRPRLGVSAGELTEERAEELKVPADTKGVVVLEVLKGTPAEKAGLKADDVILTVSGKVVEGPAGLVTVLREAKPGADVDVVIVRGGKKTTLKGVKLAAPEGDAPRKADPKPKKTPKAEAEGGEGGKPLTFEYKLKPVEGGSPLTLELKPTEGVKPLTLELAKPAEGLRLDVPLGFSAKPAVLVKPAAGKVKFESTNIQINDGKFQIEAGTADARYRVTGTVEDGKPVASRIRVLDRTEPDKAETYKSVDEVPAEHQAAVKQLLSGISGGGR